MSVTFTQQPSPASLVVPAGGTITYTVQATGTPNTITYAWYSGTPTITPPLGAPVYSNSSTLSIPNATSANALSYYAVATNGVTSAASNAGVVTVTTVMTVSTQPTSQSAKVGKPVTFTAAVTGGQTPYTYTWYINGAPASPQPNSGTFTITSPTKAQNASQVYVKVTDSSTIPQTVTSSTATLTVKSSIAWWVYALIAAAVVLVIIIIIVIIIIVLHKKKSTVTSSTTTTSNTSIQQPPPPLLMGQPVYGGFTPGVF
jgi:hypothetical protein